MADSSNVIRRLIGEFRRRRVLESAGLYIAAGWVCIEAAATLFPVFGFPDWAIRLLVYGVIATFPFFMAAAWMFNLTLRGLVRTGATPTEQLVSPADMPHRSVAILPFSNQTGNADNDYFADGMAEELLNMLAKVADLKVAARTSSFALRDRADNVRHIGGLLGVRHVLAGSVRQAGQRIRITAQLVETVSGYQLWSDTYDRDVGDVFAVQDEIAAAIAQSLEVAISDGAPGEREQSALPTQNIDAYQHVLRANYLWARRGADAIAGAIGALEQALQLDPDYAEAHARLASARAIMHEYSDEPREEGFAVAEAHARRAISLDPSLGEPHAVLGYMALRLWHWAEAEQRLQQAIQLDPGLPISYQWYANLLGDFAREDDAMQQIRAAHRLDPLSPQANNILALMALLADDEGLAAKHAGIAREYGMGGMIPDIVEFMIAVRAGKYKEALPGWQACQQRISKDAGWVEPVLAALADASQKAPALDALSQAQRSGRINGAQLFFHYLLLGEAELTFNIASTRLADHSLTHVWFMLREAAQLRRHPRFHALMETMGLCAYWNETGYPPKVRHLAPDQAA
ncbi:MAG: hypothetical protein HKN06_05860 [Gammaproteobacteria bacterium]|nr:hypothetical protein [Gammaproteobacteria bacterium]